LAERPDPIGVERHRDLAIRAVVVDTLDQQLQRAGLFTRGLKASQSGMKAPSAESTSALLTMLRRASVI
jgi:hypothetical protein